MITAIRPRPPEPRLIPVERVRLVKEARPPEETFEHVVGRSRALRHALDQVALVAPTDATVLVLGETGTGKERIARAIHDQSGRHARRFVKINCAAIPSGLFESELFGHERGAFTGAVAQRVGRFELASGSTLFLDEVGDIPLELQAKLLRVLQEQEFERLGATRTTKEDSRLVAATNRDLREMMQTVRFRDDLYYRLNVFPIAVPPLRDRPEDVEPLVRHFVARFARRMQRRIETIPDDTLAALRRHPWPGNVRELENLVERSIILSSGASLAVPLGALAPRPSDPGRPSTLEAAERAHIMRVLEEANWIIGGPHGAAARLGIARTTVQSRLKRLGLAVPRATERRSARPVNPVNPDGGECMPRCDASSRCRRDFLWDSGMSVLAGAGPRETAGSVNLARQYGDHVVTDLPREIVRRTASLRITTTYQLAAETGAAYILELNGELQGDSVEELRRVWRPLRDAVAGVPIRVVLADVEFVDAAGKALLAEMHRAGTLVV